MKKYIFNLLEDLLIGWLFVLGTLMLLFPGILPLIGGFICHTFGYYYIETLRRKS